MWAKGSEGEEEPCPILFPSSEKYCLQVQAIESKERGGVGQGRD